MECQLERDGWEERERPECVKGCVCVLSGVGIDGRQSDTLTRTWSLLVVTSQRVPVIQGNRSTIRG